MSSFAITLILLSAVLHAGWNLYTKQSSPTAGFFLAANSIGAWIFFPWLLYYPRIVTTMPGEIWALLFLTGLFQAIYCIALAGAYRHGDLSITYPIARSLPVIFVPIVTLMLGRGELLGKLFWAGVFLVLAGGVLVSAEEILPSARRRILKGALPLAVLAAAGTTGYSLIDDSALRIVRDIHAGTYGAIPVTLVYAFMEAIFCAGWIGLFLILSRKSPSATPVPLARAAGAGVLMYLTYAMVLLSMAYARDVSLIVAFRQVSILIGAFMGLAILKETSHRWKILGLGLLFSGLIIVAVS